MEIITIKCKKVGDIVQCNVPETNEGVGVLTALYTQYPHYVLPTGRYQFVMQIEDWNCNVLPWMIENRLNPDVVKVEEI